jgi:hypothetical protein
MENISLSIIYLRTNKEAALAANQVYLNRTPEFQRNYEAWDDKLRTRFIESILLNRATNPIWTVLNDTDESEEILDGMHRITTALSYLNNQFEINKNYLMTLNPDIYGKKKFNDLSVDDKAKIRNYQFIFNKLDSSYRKDLNKLQDMYEILNRSSRTLNDYEFNKVLFKPFYDIISNTKTNFLSTKFFSKIKDERGNIDTELIEILVLSNKLPNSWSSIRNLQEVWIKENIGDTNESVIEFMNNNGDNIKNKLDIICKFINDFYQRNLFAEDNKIFKKFYLPYKFILARCCYLINSYPLFNRICDTIINKFKEEILTENIETILNCSTRNAQFQKRFIERVDTIISDVLKDDDTTRRFTKKMIKDKLIIQNNICPSCKKIIKDNDDYEGDHIIPWTAGGNTTMDNLQVLHKRCHQLKSS